MVRKTFDTILGVVICAVPLVLIVAGIIAQVTQKINAGNPLNIAGYRNVGISPRYRYTKNDKLQLLLSAILFTIGILIVILVTYA